MNDARRNLIILSCFYPLFFMAGGVISQYLPIYYSDAGFDYNHVGIIMAVAAVISVIAQPLWASICDKSTNKNNIFRIVIIISLFSIWLIPAAGGNLILILLAVGVFTSASSTIGPLNDTIAIEMAKKHGFKYSTVRMLGSLGYASTTAVTGYIAGIHIKYIFPMYFIFMAAALFMSLTVPSVTVRKADISRVKFTELFKDKTFVFLLGYAFILSVTSSFSNSFHGIYSRESGITIGLIGIGTMIGSISQFPTMFLFGKCYRKFGMKKLLMISGVVYALRWVLYATVLSTQTIFLIWAIHGLTYILLFLSLVEYIQSHIPPQLSTRAMVLVNLTLFGYSGIIGSSLGGVLSSIFGIGHVYLIMGAVCITATVIFWNIYDKIMKMTEEK